MFLAASRAAGAVVAIVGAPFDGGSTFRRGARFGPAEIRWASHSLETYSPRTRADLAAIPFADLGDVALGADPASAVAAVRGALDTMGAAPLVLGGDHLVTLGALQALAARHPGLWVVQLDAHTDLRDTYEEARLSHATVMRRAAEVVGARIVQLGVRAGTAEEFAYAAQHLAWSSAATELPAQIAARLRGAPVYVTLDIDVLDPAIAPGTGNPEPLGASVADVLRALEALRGARIVGADVVEVAPPLDPSGRTAIVAAWLVRELILEIGTRNQGPGIG